MISLATWHSDGTVVGLHRDSAVPFTLNSVAIQKQLADLATSQGGAQDPFAFLLTLLEYPAVKQNLERRHLCLSSTRARGSTELRGT